MYISWNVSSIRMDTLNCFLDSHQRNLNKEHDTPFRFNKNQNFKLSKDYTILVFQGDRDAFINYGPLNMIKDLFGSIEVANERVINYEDTTSPFLSWHETLEKYYETTPIDKLNKEIIGVFLNLLVERKTPNWLSSSPEGILMTRAFYRNGRELEKKMNILSKAIDSFYEKEIIPLIQEQ